MKRSSPPRPTTAFLDRDGTLIRDTGYVSTPEEVELLAGAAEAVRLLNEAGVPVVVVTNQSGIGRGLFDLSAYLSVEARVAELLSAGGAKLSATYYCPHAPEDRCECRKPGLALYRRAADELGVETAGALYAGDRLRDVLPASRLGGRGMLVGGRDEPYDGRVPPGVARVSDLLTGVRELLGLPGSER